MAKHEPILKHSIEEGTKALKQPVKYIFVNLSDIPQILYPQKRVPNSPIREKGLGPAMGTAVHNRLELEKARADGSNVRKIFPTLPESRTLDTIDDLSDLPEDDSPRVTTDRIHISSLRDSTHPGQPFLFERIPLQTRRDALEIASHAKGVTKRHLRQFLNGFPAWGETTIETRTDIEIGGCKDGYQVVVIVKPDFVTTLSPTEGDYTTDMVVIKDIKNFPMRRNPDDTHDLQRKLTMAAFAKFKELKLARRARTGPPLPDHQRPFRASAMEIIRRLRTERSPYLHIAVYHDEVHISTRDGYQVDRSSMTEDGIVEFLKSEKLYILVARAKRQYKAQQRQKPPSQRAKGSQYRSVIVTDAIL